MVRAWPSADVVIVLQFGTVRAMFQRPRRFDVTAGGRVDARGAGLLLWSGSDPRRQLDVPAFLSSGRRSDRSELRELAGCFYVRRRDPDPEPATIWRLEWHPQQSGTEAEVRRAIAVLGGPET